MNSSVQRIVSQACQPRFQPVPKMPRIFHLALLGTSLTQYFAQVNAQETVALIIAGFSNGDVDEEDSRTASVELFGCPDRAQDSYSVEDYPFPDYFSASVFYDGYALSCGGFVCEQDFCGSTDKCFSWRPRDGNEDQWQEHSVMYEKNWNFIIAEGPDLDSDDTNTMTLITIGPSFSTQIYDPDKNEWRYYRLLPETELTSWAAHRCVVQVGTKVYHIDDNLHILDLLDWEIEDYGPVPVGLAGPSRCTSQTIDDRPGILLKNGFWYDIEGNTWEERAFPPDANFLMDSPPNEYSFRGKVTIFGNPFCDSEGYCKYQDVVQYDEVDDVWTSIGQMYLQREILDVVEVPVKWCEEILGPSAGTTSVDDITPDPSTTDPPLPGEGTDNVAMIVGGIDGLPGSTGDILSSVELFGCPGYQGQSLPIEDFPLIIYGTGGHYFEDEGYALVCGGMACEFGSPGSGCDTTTDCYTYRPGEGWTAFASLNFPKWQHLVAPILRIGDDAGNYYHAVLGMDEITEIYNPLDQIWVEYRYLPEVLWRTTDCLIQHGDYIYNIRNVFTRFDTTTWQYEELYLPLFLRSAGTCAMVRVNGFIGKLFT